MLGGRIQETSIEPWAVDLIPSLLTSVLGASFNVRQFESQYDDFDNGDVALFEQKLDKLVLMWEEPKHHAAAPNKVCAVVAGEERVRLLIPGLILGKCRHSVMAKAAAVLAQPESKERDEGLYQLLLDTREHVAYVFHSDVVVLLCSELSALFADDSRHSKTIYHSKKERLKKRKMVQESASNDVEFLQTALQLKKQKRTGWVLRNVESPESVADHSYGVALCAMLIHDDKINWQKACMMALVHDMAESLVGDYAPGQVSQAEKQKQEHNAMHTLIYEKLKGSPRALEINALWQEYEERTTAEAKLVKDLDRFEMILQAHAYEQNGQSKRSLQEFFDSVKGKIQHPLVQSWQRVLENKRSNTATSAAVSPVPATTSNAEEATALHKSRKYTLLKHFLPLESRLTGTHTKVRLPQGERQKGCIACCKYCVKGQPHTNRKARETFWQCDVCKVSLCKFCWEPFHTVRNFEAPACLGLKPVAQAAAPATRQGTRNQEAIHQPPSQSEGQHQRSRKRRSISSSLLY